MSAGGDSLGIGYGVAVDRLGNSHVVGGFTSSQAAFGSVVLTNAGSVGIFIAKYDDAGNILWVRQAGGSASDEARAIAVDASGNSYVTGFFTSPTATFGGITLTNRGSFDVFVAKYDNTGNVLWAKAVGDSDNDEGLAIAVDKAGNSYVTGVFAGSPGGGIWDMFIAKYDSAGTLLWFKRAGGAGDDRGNGIALDANGNIFVAGAFGSTVVRFDSITLTNGELSSVYLAKYDNSGNVLWVRQSQGSGNDGAASVGVDAMGNVYMAGSFSSSSISCGGTTITNSGPTGFDSFVAKYDPAGNILWAKQAGGTEGLAFGSSIAVTETGSSYVSGYFGSDNAYFNGDIVLTNKGGIYEVFIAKYDTGGNVLWAKSAGGVSEDEAYGIAVDAVGNCYVTGHSSSNPLVFDSIVLSGLEGNVFLARVAPENMPFIIVQPKSQSAFVEDDVWFRVQAGGDSPLTYQWRFNGESIVSATNATLALNHVQFEEAGEYTVSVANAFGEVTSVVVTLTAKPLARLVVRSGLNKEGFELLVTGAVGRSYRIQSSTDLKTWTDLFSFTNSEQTTLFLDSKAASFARRFYRVASP